jgi:hypothetical protein
MSSIERWCGRFGNNIQQISNAIFYCQENKLNFISPDNELINTFSVSFNTTNNSCHTGLYFFHVPSITGQGGPHFTCDLDKIRKERRNICRKYIYPNLKLNFNNINKLDSDTIVLHIRSGDIFSRENYYCPVVSRYIQNPLRYYLDVIKDYNKVILLTEDYVNPVIKELSKIDKIEVKICSILETIEIMLSSRNIATSGISSFPIACILLSENIENIYCSSIKLDEIINYKEILDTNVKIHITEIDMDRYINYNEWLNIESQRKIMIEY